MVGFRTFIKNIADSLNLKGFSENLPDGDHKIVCEAEKDIKERHQRYYTRLLLSVSRMDGSAYVGHGAI